MALGQMTENERLVWEACKAENFNIEGMIVTRWEPIDLFHGFMAEFSRRVDTNPLFRLEVRRLRTDVDGDSMQIGDVPRFYRRK